ncbi:MAG TPA: cytochrome b [Burkholderiales bacterium]|nr:cytochrome b [Burkholderiales bacterium]
MSPQRYDRFAVILHWTVGLAVLGQFALGWWMLALPKGGDGTRAWWFNVHKSIGITLAAFVVLRLIWRATHAAPALPAGMPAWQRLAASASHAGLYACMLILPLSGYLGSSFSRYPIKYFGMPLPHWGWEWAAAKNLMSAVHETAAWALAALITLHVGAALWHLMRGDGVIRRMWA